jgi:hypothetical protein
MHTVILCVCVCVCVCGSSLYNRCGVPYVRRKYKFCSVNWAPRVLWCVRLHKAVMMNARGWSPAGRGGTSSLSLLAGRVEILLVTALGKPLPGCLAATRPSITHTFRATSSVLLPRPLRTWRLVGVLPAFR